MWRGVQLGGARGIALLRTLILARLLVPDDFGLLAISWLTFEIGMAFTEFGLRQALLQRPSIDSRDRDTAWTVELVRACAVVSVILVGAPLIAELFGEPRAAPLIRIIAASQIIDALESIGLVDLSRSLRFRPQAAISLTGSIVFTIVAIVLAPSLGVWGVAVGVVAGSVTQTVMSYIIAPYRPRIVFDRQIARTLFIFGRWVYLSRISAVLGSAVLQAVISRQLGAAALGVYFLSVRIALLPRTLMRLVAGDVMFPLHARLQGDVQRASRAFGASVSALWLLAVPIYIVLAALAPSLVDDILGAQWQAAELPLRVLAFAAIASGLADATIPMLQGRGHPGRAATLVVVRSLTVIALAWSLAGGYGVVGAALAWLVAEVVVQVLSVVMVLWAETLSRPFSGIGQRAVAIAVAAMGGGLTAAGLERVLIGPIGMLVSGALGAGVAFALVWLLDRIFRFDLLEDLTLAFPFLARLRRS
jgi:PST family polysaccharide transporter/lipopolysaccharide exporter